MIQKKQWNILLLLLLNLSAANAQLKSLAEDFEGLATRQFSFKKEGLFTYGAVNAVIVEQRYGPRSGYLGDRAIKVTWSGKDHFGGWGKGISSYTSLNGNSDYLNFYVINPKSSDTTSIKVIIETGEKNASQNNQHQWLYEMEIAPLEDWQLISIPLKKFRNTDGDKDSELTTGFKYDKLLTINFSFLHYDQLKAGQFWLFDFISFSKGPLPTGKQQWMPVASESEGCMLGAWSEEGIDGNLQSIPGSFEKIFKNKYDRKLDVIHFFQPFSTASEQHKNLYPPVDQINRLIREGYQLMITVENHHINPGKRIEQPNLYSIVEGHHDDFFREWAQRIKQINGVLLVRILHEFNGDWYPWSLINNDKNPQLYVQAYRHICDIMKSEGTGNIRFIWCPNSMSVPQARWNDMMEAYPGDEYVDYVGIDVYNGAGEKGIPLWRSFRKEAAEASFLLTELLPHKPLLICETSSRERKPAERGPAQGKDRWIEQMAEALQHDFSQVRMLVWFNENRQFRINSSPSSSRAFLEKIWKNPYFQLSKISPP